MSPFDFLPPGTAPFAIALMVVAAIAILEAVSMLAGHALSGLVDHAVPDLHVDPGSIADGAVHLGPFESALDWLSVGRVPLLVVVILFLTGFGVGGIAIQSLARSLAGAPLGQAYAVAGALVLGVLAMRVLGRAVGRILPREETAAIARDALVGRTATIMRGTARRGLPAEARLRDEHGTSHYILIEPDRDDETLAPGTDVLILAVEGHKAIATPAP